MIVAGQRWRTLRSDPPSRRVQHDYIERARDLRIAAAGERAMGRAHRSRRMLGAAILLEQAAVAEYIDPQPSGLGRAPGGTA